MRHRKQEIEIKLRVEDAAALGKTLRRVGARATRRVFERNDLFDTAQATLRKRGQLLRLRQEVELEGKGPGTRDRGSGIRERGSRKERRMGGSGKARKTEGSFAALRMTGKGRRYVLTFKGSGMREGRKGGLKSVRLAARAGPFGSAQGGRDVSYTLPGNQGGQAESLPHSRYKVREETEYVLPEARGFLAMMKRVGMRRTYRYEKIRTSYRVRGTRGAHLELDETPVGVFLELEGSRRAIDRLARRLGYGPRDYLTLSYAALHFLDCRRRGVPAGNMVFGRRRFSPG